MRNHTQEETDEINAMIPFAMRYADKSLVGRSFNYNINRRNQAWNIAYNSEMDRLTKEAGLRI